MGYSRTRQAYIRKACHSDRLRLTIFSHHDTYKGRLSAVVPPFFKHITMFLIDADNEATRHLLLGVLCSEMLFESYVPHVPSGKVLQPVNLSLCRCYMCTPLSHYIYIFKYSGECVKCQGSLQLRQGNPYLIIYFQYDTTLNKNSKGESTETLSPLHISYFTVTFIVAFFFPHATVIVAFPFFFALTTPYLSTDAILFLPDL